MQHSKIVGGSTAKRVINCPGSVALVQKMPPQVEGLSTRTHASTVISNVGNRTLERSGATVRDSFKPGNSTRGGPGSLMNRTGPTKVTSMPPATGFTSSPIWRSGANFQ